MVLMPLLGDYKHILRVRNHTTDKIGDNKCRIFCVEKSTKLLKSKFLRTF